MKTTKRLLPLRPGALSLCFAILVSVLFTASSAFAATTAADQTSNIQDNCAPYPGNAQPPVYCYPDSVTVTSTSIDPICISRDDPTGIKMVYTTYKGLSYTDVNDTTFVGWYNNWSPSGSTTETGPYTVTSTSVTWECTLPGL